MLIDSSSLQLSKALLPIIFAVVGMMVFLQPKIRTFVDFSIIALQLFRESYTRLFGSTVMEQSPLQRKKAFRPILDTLDGMFIFVKLEQSMNAFSPIAVTVEGITLLQHPTINEFVAVTIIALQLSRESYFKLLISTEIDDKLRHSLNASL